MTNVGTPDRILRIVLGVLLLALPFIPVTAGLFAGWGSWRFVMAAVGVVLVATAVFRFCPLYRVLGMNTCGLR